MAISGRKPSIHEIHRYSRSVVGVHKEEYHQKRRAHMKTVQNPPDVVFKLLHSFQRRHIVFANLPCRTAIRMVYTRR